MNITTTAGMFVTETSTSLLCSQSSASSETKSQLKDEDVLSGQGQQQMGMGQWWNDGSHEPE
jgi:hypothetical protein